MKKRAFGGRTVLMNGKGSIVADDAMKTADDGFKRGGKAKKRKHGGMVEGSAAEERLDKRARGGSVYSSGKVGRDDSSGKDVGTEGESVPGVR